MFLFQFSRPLSGFWRRSGGRHVRPVRQSLPSRPAPHGGPPEEAGCGATSSLRSTHRQIRASSGTGSVSLSQLVNTSECDITRLASLLGLCTILCTSLYGHPVNTVEYQFMLNVYSWIYIVFLIFVGSGNGERLPAQVWDQADHKSVFLRYDGELRTASARGKRRLLLTYSLFLLCKISEELYSLFIVWWGL